MDDIRQGNESLKNHILSLKDPSAWAATRRMTEESLRDAVKQPWLKDIDRVYLVGHGTSFATSENAEVYFARIAKLPARALPAFQFLNYIDDYPLDGNALVVGISCSGNTASVVKSLELAQKKGARTACLSGEGDIKSADFADLRILTDARAERRVNVSAYSVSHLFLLLAAYRLAMVLGEARGALDEAESAAWTRRLDAAIGSLSCLPELFDRMRDITASLLAQKAVNFMVLGTGPNIGTMREGALKICEFCWHFSAGEELEDFAHGRFREVGKVEPLLIIAPSGVVTGKLMDLMAGSYVSDTPTVVLTDEAGPALEKMATHVVKLPKLEDEYLTPFLYIFPLWFLGYHVREMEGGLVGERRHGLLAVDINFKAHFDESGNRLG